MGDKDIAMIDVFINQTIAGSGDETSDPIPLWAYKPVGYFSLQVHSAGAGSVIKLEYQLSNDGVTYVTPSGASDIVTAHGVGDVFYDFAPELAKFMKIKATETAGNDVTDLDVKMAIQ